MSRDPYTHAHGHSQQPGNEWNDSRWMRAPNPGGGGGGGAWNPGVTTGGGGGSGIGFLVLVVIGAAIAIPAAAMALLSTPLLKIYSSLIAGTYKSRSWLTGLMATQVGGMWYLGISAVVFFLVEGYLTVALDAIPSTLDGLATWQQWLTATGAAAATVIEWTARLWGLGDEYEQYRQLYPPTIPFGLAALGAATLHLPGLLAYSLVLRRAGYLKSGLSGVIVGIGVALVLVLLTLPLVIWAGSLGAAALLSA